MGLEKIFRTGGITITAKELYDIALNLLGFKNDDGSDNRDCDDLATRSVSLINVLIAETLWLDRKLKKSPNEGAVYITAEDEALFCHSLLCTGVLPYGLAALLVAGEDEDLYKMMYERYLTALKDLEGGTVGTRHEIDDCYASE